MTGVPHSDSAALLWAPTCGAVHHRGAGQIRRWEKRHLGDQPRFAALKPLGDAMSTRCITFGALSKQFEWLRHEWVLSDRVVHDKLFVALHMCGKTPLPQKHCHPRFVGSLEYVLMEHYTVRGCRLSGVSPPTRHTIGYCAYSAAEPYTIKWLVNDSMVEKLGALVVIDGHMDWDIDSTASVEAQFFS